MPGKIYATHLFIPTELHSGTDGTSVVLICAPVDNIKSHFYSLATVFLTVMPKYSSTVSQFGVNPDLAMDIGCRFLQRKNPKESLNQDLSSAIGTFSTVFSYLSKGYCLPKWTGNWNGPFAAVNGHNDLLSRHRSQRNRHCGLGGTTNL